MKALEMIFELFEDVFKILNVVLSECLFRLGGDGVEGPNHEMTQAADQFIALHQTSPLRCGSKILQHLTKPMLHVDTIHNR